MDLNNYTSGLEKGDWEGLVNNIAERHPDIDLNNYTSGLTKGDWEGLVNNIAENYKPSSDSEIKQPAIQEMTVIPDSPQPINNPVAEEPGMFENIVNSIPNPVEVVGQLGSEIMNVGDVLSKNIVAPVGRLVEEGINSFRDPKDKTNYFKDAIDVLQTKVATYNEANPHQLVSPGTIVETGIMASYLPGTLAKTAVVEGTLSMLNGIGNSNSIEGRDMAKDFSIGVVFSMLAKAAGEVIDARTNFNRASKDKDNLSSAVNVLLKSSKDLDRKEVIELLKDVKPENQIQVLIETSDVYTKYIKEALDSDEMKGIYRAYTQKQTAGMDQQLGEAKVLIGNYKKDYKNWENKLLEDRTKFEIPSLGEYKDAMTKLYSGIGGRGQAIVNRLDSKVTLSEALYLRQDINKLIRKAKGAEYDTLKAVKGKMDEILETGLKDAYIGLQKTIENYGKGIDIDAAQNILNKNTKQKITDWTQVKKDLKKAGVKNEAILDMTDSFEQAFRTNQTMRSGVASKGEEKINFLGAMGYIYGKIIKGLALFGDTAKTIHIKKAVEYSIKNNDGDVIKAIIDNVDIPNSIKSDIIQDIKPKMSKSVTKHTTVLDESVPPKVADDIIDTEIVNKQLPNKQNGLPEGGKQGQPPVNDLGTNSDTLTVSPTGNVGTQQGVDTYEVMLKQLGGNYDTKVIKHIDNIVSSKRIETQLSKVSNKLKADDMEYNKQIVSKTIDTEINNVVSIIEKQSGVKLSKADVDKLYKLKLKELMKGCK